MMTEKQELVYELALVHAALDWPPYTEKKINKMSIGVVKACLREAKKELSK